MAPKEVELKKLKKAEKISLLKDMNIKNYSGKSVSELDIMLLENGIKDISIEPSKEEKKSKKAKSDKPRVEKINKKLEKSVSVEDHKDNLSEFKDDVTDEELYEVVKDIIIDFILSEELTHDDHKKYIKDYLTAHDFDFGDLIEKYVKHNKKACFKDKTSEEINFELSTFIYSIDNKVHDLLVKKLRRHVVTTNKPKKEPAPKKEKVGSATKKAVKSKSKKVDESEEESEDSDNESEASD